MTNKEQQIIDAITSQLARIAPGVVFTIDGRQLVCTELLRTVAPERLTAFKPEDFPAVFIETGGANLAADLDAFKDHDLDVKLLVITAEADGQSAIRAMMADITAAMEEDRTFGGLAISTDYQARSMGSTEHDPLPSMTYTVRYRSYRGEM